MPVTSNASGKLMPSVPALLRSRIVSGMRWTLWLSLLAAPFSYGTNILLARTGPQVIGTFGLLSVYVGIVSSLFYLGGDAVVIKFIPELEPDQRFPFLASYFLVTIMFLAPWLAAASLWPQELHYLFGDRAGVPFYVLVLYLSPLYIIFSLVVAALKAMLEMRWAQTLMRVLTIGSFLLYAVLFIAFRALLKSHCSGLIWGIYLGLTALAIVFGLWRLVQLKSWACNWHSFHFFLPRGFWRYTLSQEQASAVWFFIERLDLILVLNCGGLVLLGQYIVVIALGEIIRLANRVFLETLLPSLTNLLAQRNLSAASQVLSLNFRILFIVDTAVTCGMMFLVGPIAALWGPQYASLRPLFLLSVFFCGLSAPGAVGSTLLSSVGKQQRAVWIALGQLGLFTALFLSLWPRWQLLGAVLATGISTFVANITMLAVARYSVPMRFSVGKDYAKFVLVGSVAGLVAMRLMPLGPVGAALAWVSAVVSFLAWAQWHPQELVGLLRHFLPGSFASTGSEA